MYKNFMGISLIYLETPNITLGTTYGLLDVILTVILVNGVMIVQYKISTEIWMRGQR